MYSRSLVRRLLLGVLILGLVLDLGLYAWSGLPRLGRGWALRGAPLASRRAAAREWKEQAPELAAFQRAMADLPRSAERVLLAVGPRNAWFAPFAWQDLAPALILVQPRARRGRSQLIAAARAAGADTLLYADRELGWQAVEIQP